MTSQNLSNRNKNLRPGYKPTKLEVEEELGKHYVDLRDQAQHEL